MPGFHFMKYNTGDAHSVLGSGLLPNYWNCWNSPEECGGAEIDSPSSVASWLTGKP